MIYRIVDCHVQNARSRKAVNSTKGMVLTDAKGEVIQTYYYSTSWGYSASGKDVWSTSADISYLPEKLQVVKGSRKRGADVDLSNEVSFQSFIDKPAYDTYDSDSPWYRWHMTVSQKNLSARITNLVEQCYAADEEQILTQTKSGSYRSRAIKNKKDTGRKAGKKWDSHRVSTGGRKECHKGVYAI